MLFSTTTAQNDLKRGGVLNKHNHGTFQKINFSDIKKAGAELFQIMHVYQDRVVIWFISPINCGYEAFRLHNISVFGQV
jgi:hypothetical protein